MDVLSWEFNPSPSSVRHYHSSCSFWQWNDRRFNFSLWIFIKHHSNSSSSLFLSNYEAPFQLSDCPIRVPVLLLCTPGYQFYDSWNNRRGGRGRRRAARVNKIKCAIVTHLHHHHHLLLRPRPSRLLEVCRCFDFPHRVGNGFCLAGRHPWIL